MKKTDLETEINWKLYKRYKEKKRAALTYEEKMDAFLFGLAWVPEYITEEKPEFSYAHQLKLNMEAFKNG